MQLARPGAGALDGNVSPADRGEPACPPFALVFSRRGVATGRKGGVPTPSSVNDQRLQWLAHTGLTFHSLEPLRWKAGSLRMVDAGRP